MVTMVIFPNPYGKFAGIIMQRYFEKFGGIVPR